MSPPVWRVARSAPGYPPALCDLADPPVELWGVGEPEALAFEPEGAVTIVGARRSGSYGLGVAKALGSAAARAGLVTVSGMALGCDSAAHEGALAEGGRAVAVLGGGPDVPSPASRAPLYRRILETGGAVIAEYPPGTTPQAGFFPRRNRIMSALAGLTVVVEGTLRSGTQHTARETLELGRELGAVPGPVTSVLSELPNDLIHAGAHVIRGGEDLVEILLGVGAADALGAGPALDPDPALVLDAVEAGAATADAVASATGMEGHATAVALARLELMGYVLADASGRYARSLLRLPEGEGLED